MSLHDWELMELRFQVQVLQEFLRFENWWNFCSSRNCCKDSWFRMCSRKCVFPTEWNYSSSSGGLLKYTRMCVWKLQVRDTENTDKKMSVRLGFLSPPPVACTTFANVCTGNLWKKRSSVAITLSTNCDLAIECLGVRAFESLDVHVATIVVKIMKRKVATSRFSNIVSAIPGLLAMLHRMVFPVLSRSPDLRDSVVLVLVEGLWEFAKWT